MCHINNETLLMLLLADGVCSVFMVMDLLTCNLTSVDEDHGLWLRAVVEVDIQYQDECV